MDLESREDVMKIAVGGCGSQLGMFAGCGSIISALVALVICAVTGFLTISINDFARDFASLAIPAIPSAGNGILTFAPDGNETGAGQSPSDTIPREPYRAGPFVTANDGNVNLRFGTNTRYPIIVKLPGNASLEIIGRNTDAS